ncbi:MAG: 1-acyl-sn-glycerol-3-phosphate acyltransferase [Dehalococcoidia bacterium]|nr:1-acyl-sn-glycerol-3-phosphate acyltransferase [Bacillota bacterium]
MFYWIMRKIFIFIFKFLFRWEIAGREHLPREGGCILCSNHFSWWDPPLVGCLTKRIVHFMSKEEMFQGPVFSKVMPLLHAFPVRRNSADRRAIRRALEILKSGEVLGIFPEGTRSRTDELLVPHSGVALIAIKSEVPVIPIAIIGSFKILRRIKVRIGAPISFPEYYGLKNKAEKLEEVAGKIMQEIDRLRKKG